MQKDPKIASTSGTVLMNPQTVLAAAAMDGDDLEVETTGFRYAEIIAIVGPTTTIFTVQIEGSLVTGGGGVADIVGALLTFSATDDETTRRGIIDLHLAKAGARTFLGISTNSAATGGTGGDIAVICKLWAAEDSEQQIGLAAAAADFEV